MDHIKNIEKLGKEMNAANDRMNELVDMANAELGNAKKAEAKGMRNEYAMAIGRRRGIIMALEALGVVPTYDVETSLYHL